MPLLLFTLAALLTFIETRWVLGLLKKKQILDQPNARSNHKIPTPRGGGIATSDILIALSCCVLWFAEGNLALQNSWPLVLALITLACVSFLDDMRGISPGLRLFVQLVAAGACVPLVQTQGLVFQGLVPQSLDYFLTLLVWVYFTNAFNFMDGIDGITGAQTIAIALGIIALVFFIPELSLSIGLLAAIAAGCALGFLLWNWHPAKIFLGDVGSVPLGFFLGFLLLWLAALGFWISALILPLYYFADTGITLLRRLKRGEKIWHAHSEHFYQQAVRSGRTHSDVVKHIAFSNLLLIALAWIAARHAEDNFAWIALITACVEVARLLCYLARPFRGEGTEDRR